MWYAWCNLTWHIKAAPGNNMLNGIIVDAMRETDLVWSCQRVWGRQLYILLVATHWGLCWYSTCFLFFYFVFCLNWHTIQNIWHLFSLILHIHPVKIPEKALCELVESDWTDALPSTLKLTHVLLPLCYKPRLPIGAVGNISISPHILGSILKFILHFCHAFLKGASNKSNLKSALSWCCIWIFFLLQQC